MKAQQPIEQTVALFYASVPHSFFFFLQFIDGLVLLWLYLKDAQGTALEMHIAIYPSVVVPDALAEDGRETGIVTWHPSIGPVFERNLNTAVFHSFGLDFHSLEKSFPCCHGDASYNCFVQAPNTNTVCIKTDSVGSWYVTSWERELIIHTILYGSEGNCW